MKKTGQLALVLALALAGTARPAPAEFNPFGYTLRLVGHAHIDLAWLWRWEETLRDVVTQTFRGTLDIMDKVKGLTFAQSQVCLYEAVEQDDSRMFDRIKAKVREGTWVPVGGMWAESDLNLTDGESLVRQLLYGQRYLREKLGVQARVGWSPDSFGHNAQLPQILKKSMIDFYILERCVPDKTPVFWWEAPDSSRVLAYAPPGWYNLSLRSGIQEHVAAAAENSPLKDFMILYGEGDHGGGPRRTDVEAYRKSVKSKSWPRMAFADPNVFFDRIIRSGIEFPVVKRELNFTFRGCYTSQARIKKLNRRAESLLLAAEKFSGLAQFAGFRDYYPERDLDEAWKVVLRHQFHDILDGSSIGPVYEDAAESFRRVMERGRRALDFSLETITNVIDTRGPGRPVIVFNSLFWERTGEVEAELDVPRESADAGLRLVDPEGRDVPCQVLKLEPRGGAARMRVLFVAEKVPSFGYKVYRLDEARGKPSEAPGLSVSETLLENEFFRVVLNPEGGGMRSILDKRSGREVLSGEGNVLEAIADEPENMSAWELGLKDRVGRVGQGGALLEVVEKGPVRVTVRVTGSFRGSWFVQDISLYRGLPRIDCRLKFDWQERNIMIKAAFPAAARNSQAYFEIPFGAVSRPTDGTEVPALRWIDLTDETGEFGLSLLNDCKHGFDVKDNVLRLSVIHGPTYPDPEADRGPQELLYSLYPHAGSWREAGTIRRGYELNSALEARPAMVHSGSWPASASFIKAEPEGVVVSAFKKEYGYFYHGFILRFYEAFGKTAEVKLELPWPVRAEEANLIDYTERALPLKDGKISFTLKPYEIKAIKIYRLLPSGE